MPIALLTDFGTSDYYVGAMKGVVFSINPAANVIDITHEIAPQDIASASFVLRACYQDFPVGTVFLCVVDPGVGSDRRAIVVETERYYFVGPDNGLFSFVLDENATVHAIESRQYFRPLVSSTFHGRDIFAPVAAHISKGVEPKEFGPRIDDPIVSADSKPTKIGENTIEGRVIHIDRFGNLVTNILLTAARNFVDVEINGRHIRELRDTYAGAATDVPFAIVGSAGFLEISLNRGSASEFLGTSVGSKVILQYTDRLS